MNCILRMRELLLSSRELQRTALRYGIILIFSATIANWQSIHEKHRFSIHDGCAVNSRTPTAFNSQQKKSFASLQNSLFPYNGLFRSLPCPRGYFGGVGFTFSTTASVRSPYPSGSWYLSTKPSFPPKTLYAFFASSISVTSPLL